jgi:hypothetical protein
VADKERNILLRVESSLADAAVAWLTAKRIVVYALAIAVVTNIAAVALYIHVPAFAETPGADFVQFYSAAILARTQPDKLYDSDAQKEIQKRFSLAARRGVYWPYLHAPFFTFLLMPLGRVSYVTAYWAWTAFTGLLVCLSMIMLTLLDPARRPSLKLSLAIVSAAPVLYWLILTGQTTAVALFVWAVAFVLIKQDRLFWSGFVLGLLSYRVQYLTVLLPLIVIRRMWSAVFGFGVSVLLLVTAGGLMFSFDSYRAYSQAVAEQAQRIVSLTQPLSHYVTLFGFFRALLPNDWAIAATMLTSLLVIYWLWRLWRNVVSPRSDVFDLQWAMLMIATLLLMHHGFVYDLILLTLPLLLLFPWLSEISPYYKIYLVLLYFIPYVLLIFPQLPFDPIQPLLMALCFEVYRVHSRTNIECVLQSA